MSSRVLKLAFVFAAALPSVALGADLATGKEIIAAVTGNTIEGGMTETGAYSEFYAADGSIKADGYTGIWAVKGDTMCFSYDGEPLACIGVRIKGDAVTWVEEGKDSGTGKILKGNPYNF
jgi:hypothetical protein